MVNTFLLAFIIVLMQQFSSTLTDWISYVICLVVSVLFKTDQNYLNELKNSKEILLAELSSASMMDEFAKYAELVVFLFLNNFFCC